MLNKVMIIGRLGRDPELRYTQSGSPVATLNVATDESYTDRDGNKQYSDIFHAVTKSARNVLNQAVLNAYDVKLQQIQATEIEVENPPDEEMADEPADEPEPEIAM